MPHITARLVQYKYAWSRELPASLRGHMDVQAFALTMEYFNESQRVRDSLKLVLSTLGVGLVFGTIGGIYQAYDLDFTGGYYAGAFVLIPLLMSFLVLAFILSQKRRLRTRLRLAVETENAYYQYWCRQRLSPVVSVVWSITSRTVWINLSGEGKQPVEEPVILCTIITDENEPQPIAAITVVAVEGVDPSSSSTADTTTATTTATATAANSTPDISSVEGTHGRGSEGNVVIEVHAEAMPMQSSPSILTSADAAPAAAVAAVAASGSESQPINNSGAAKSSSSSSSSSSSVARFIRTTVSALTFAPASQDELDHPTSYASF